MRFRRSGIFRFEVIPQGQPGRCGGQGRGSGRGQGRGPCGRGQEKGQGRGQGQGQGQGKGQGNGQGRGSGQGQGQGRKARSFSLGRGLAQNLDQTARSGIPRLLRLRKRDGSCLQSTVPLR